MSEAAVQDLVALCRRFGALEKDVVCCGSVTVSQCAVLQDLLDGASDVSTLATRARVTKGGMTRLLDGLAKRDFIVRGRDEDDRRRVIVALTAEGRREAERLRASTVQIVEAVLAQMPEEERAAAVRSLASIRAAVDDVMERCC